MKNLLKTFSITMLLVMSTFVLSGCFGSDDASLAMADYAGTYDAIYQRTEISGAGIMDGITEKDAAALEAEGTAIVVVVGEDGTVVVTDTDSEDPLNVTVSTMNATFVVEGDGIKITFPASEMEFGEEDWVYNGSLDGNTLTISLTITETEEGVTTTFSQEMRFTKR